MKKPFKAGYDSGSDDEKAEVANGILDDENAEKKPAKKIPHPGKLHSIQITPVANGHTVTVRRSKPGAKNDYDTNETQHVFTNVDKAIEHVKDHL